MKGKYGNIGGIRMARKSDEEKLRELEEKMEQIKAQKQQVESRLKEKERKERTRRLIQVGAIFENHFDFEGQENALKFALALKYYVAKNKDKILSMSREEIENKIREQKREESIIKLK